MNGDKCLKFEVWSALPFTICAVPFTISAIPDTIFTSLGNVFAITEEIFKD